MLRTFRAQNFIPVFDTLVPSRLTSCLLDLGYRVLEFEVGHWDMRAAAQFLGSLDVVEDLEFLVHHQVSTPPTTKSKKVLHSLRRLSLTSDCSEGIDSCERFFTAFDCPNVLDAKYDFVLPLGLSHGNGITSILLLSANTPLVKYLKLVVMREPGKYADAWFDDDLMRVGDSDYLANVENLYIEHPYGKGALNGFFDFVSKVRTLRIETSAGAIGTILGALAERTNTFEGNAEDGTCLYVMEPDLHNF